MTAKHKTLCFKILNNQGLIHSKVWNLHNIEAYAKFTNQAVNLAYMYGLLCQNEQAKLVPVVHKHRITLWFWQTKEFHRFEFFHCQIKHYFVFKTMQKAHLKFPHQEKAQSHTCVMTSSEDINDKSSCYSNTKNQTG